MIFMYIWNAREYLWGKWSFPEVADHSYGWVLPWSNVKTLIHLHWTFSDWNGDSTCKIKLISSWRERYHTDLQFYKHWRSGLIITCWICQSPSESWQLPYCCMHLQINPELLFLISHNTSGISPVWYKFFNNEFLGKVNLHMEWCQNCSRNKLLWL